MKFVAIIMTFIGYVLVYAGVANGGKFATQPWMGIIDDAYSQGASQSGSSGSGGSASSSSGSATPTQKGTHITGSGASQSSSNPASTQQQSSGDSLPLKILKIIIPGGSLIP
jgi:hypothetical protein